MTPETRPHSSERCAGNALVISLLMLSLLAALAIAQSTVLHKNQLSSDHFNTLHVLHGYAESGIALAVHDLKYNASGDRGNIGSASWSSSDDLGRDGLAGTGDRGEGDGAPTPGEPNVTASAVGSSGLGYQLVTHVLDDPGGAKRVISTVASPTDLVTVEKYLVTSTVNVPRVGAVLVDPSVALDLRGNSFLIDGNDYNLDGSPSSNPALYGLATLEGSTPGENEQILTAQIPTRSYDQIVGDGGEPSIGEVSDFGSSLDQLFDDFKGVVTTTVDPGTYTDFDLADVAPEDMPVVHVEGDLHLSGDGGGTGVLIVDGVLTVSGQFEWNGLLLVGGDLRMTGGGSGIHLLGSAVVRQSLTAIEDTNSLSVGGQADLLYSSEILDQIADSLSNRPSYKKVLYREDGLQDGSNSSSSSSNETTDADA